ncbi:DEAD/DEAH box helicase family protein [Halosquirtibacter xylanolyticus]|uniref:type I restriction endonuclease subunit R n=1 Tax=Halosquirtibacter xylanolyticus TaxID=3374599 RepID=UPI0037496DFB|nr:DEAD/DEAH box helicase family protein [Prolixibacteraceae bacterium]
MSFNEDTRVKIPAIIHLTHLGYKYIDLNTNKRDNNTNIFTDIFFDAISKINPSVKEDDIKRKYHEITLQLQNNDLGKAFFKTLTSQNDIKIIDFENFNNNQFNVVTELTYKIDQEEFRPDITILINGLPLVFIEVKKPNNKDGIIAERNRINARFKNKKFIPFINITQFMIFSNNMEYDDLDREPIQGAYYATPSYGKVVFNYFRDEEFNKQNPPILDPFNNTNEDLILADNNLINIKNSPEFIQNKDPYTPTNRILSSLLHKDRLAFILNFGLAYVNESSGLQKHIMRYPQIFATKKIAEHININKTKGVVWHTQGSGKTALAYFNVKHLTSYYNKLNVIPKFYFIVDRLDLLTQASIEFTNRGLIVHKINSRNDFVKDIRSTKSVENDQGKMEITVVNIQKFKDDPNVTRPNDYNLNIQRVFFLDEVHRSYNPKGSFLANLNQSDKNAIHIGLTGTPLLKKDANTKNLFGGYIHKYYYDASIADGFTLRLIREEVQTRYKILLQKSLNDIKLLEGEIDTRDLYAHPRFAEPMLQYIVDDFEESRHIFNDPSIGAMVVCDSAKQAKELYNQFIISQKHKNSQDLSVAAESNATYKTSLDQYKVTSAEIILHDIYTKDERADIVEKFKEGKIDILFVYNMLLTGFNAPRLKKLYLGRVIKEHNLLQTLTRVNRTYKNFQYGYVVDFANIKKEFDATNKAYYNELQEELGEEFQNYSNLFKSAEEIKEDLDVINTTLTPYDTLNSEIFSQQISEIADRKEMLKITSALNHAKELYNIMRLTQQDEQLEDFDIHKINELAREANNHLALLNQKEALNTNPENVDILNLSIENLQFSFSKAGEEELIMADKMNKLKAQIHKEFLYNFDQKDIQFISLAEEFKRILAKYDAREFSQDELKEEIFTLTKVHDQIKEVNRRNNLLKAKYTNDKKYARIHKRLREKSLLSKKEELILYALQNIKTEVDIIVKKNNAILKNERYFSKLMAKTILEQLQKTKGVQYDLEAINNINILITKQYTEEFNARFK